MLYSYRITFTYKDEYTKGMWKRQSCVIQAYDREMALKKCIEWYGLGQDCEYSIVSVENIDTK